MRSTKPHFRARKMQRNPLSASGFTLIEVLIAVAIFVIVGAMAMGGYNELVKQSEHVNTSAQRTRAPELR